MATILVADDDARVLSAVTRILQNEGHEVIKAENGKEAMRILANRPADLILSDLTMPEMDGIELLIRLQEEFPGVPMLAMSDGGSMAKEELLENASLLGAVGIIEKPITVEGLVKAVSDALAEGRR